MQSATPLWGWTSLRSAAAASLIAKWNHLKLNRDVGMNKAEITVESANQSVGPLQGKCCSLPGESIKGTYFLGGAGMGGYYIAPLIRAFRSAGIKSAVYLDRDKWSGGTALDAAVGSVFGREYDPRFPMLLRTNSSGSKQFNIIGYSYGSVIAAQIAAKYAAKGTVVDHLVLIGSPISSSFLRRLRNIPYIKKIIIINLGEHGDPIYAGMHIVELFTSLPELASQMPDSEGHFYYAEPSEEGDKRRKKLAEELYKVGLR